MMLSRKQGFSDIISTLIMFIAVMGISIGIVVTIKNFALDTQNSIDYQNEIINNQLKTSIDITNIYYNSTASKLYVYVKNLGKTKLDTSEFDFYLDDSFQSNFSVFYASNFSVNMTFMFPSQTGVFVQDKALGAGTHKVKMVSGYGGVGDTDYFNS